MDMNDTFFLLILSEMKFICGSVGCRSLVGSLIRGKIKRILSPVKKNIDSRSRGNGNDCPVHADRYVRQCETTGTYD